MNKPREESFAGLAAQFDHSNMARVIAGFPSQIDRALRAALPALPARKFEEVVIVGMGGSALPTEVLLDAFGDRLKIPVTVCRSYRLQRPVTAATLVIASSFSGGTEEVIEAAETMVKTPASVVIVAKGGRLPEVGFANQCPVILLPVAEEPPGFQPRSAIGYFVTFFVRLLVAIGGLGNEVCGELSDAAEKLRHLDLRPAAEDIARWLQDRIPVVYTDDIHMMSVARIAKIKFNENSKRPAFFNAIPETNHNEMIGFANATSKFGILYLHDPLSHKAIAERYEVMKKVFAEQGLTNIEFRRWEMPGASRLEKVLAALVFCDWCSYSVALLSGIDPTPVDLVEKFKRALVESRPR